MQAIVKADGRQLTLTEGQEFDVGRLQGDVGDTVDLLLVDEALTRLEAQDSRMAQVVKLRYFAGMSVAETASALDLAPRTVNRLWTAARAWLRREFSRA